MAAQGAEWRADINDELFRMYVRNHTAAAFYMMFPYLLIGTAYYYLYGVPVGVELDIIMLCATVALITWASQQSLYERIARRKTAHGHRLYFGLICLHKLIYVPLLMVALFYPLQTDVLYAHMLGYAVIIFSLMYYTTVSAVYFPMLVFDIGLILTCGGLAAALNIDVQETRLVVPVMATVAALSLVTGRQFYSNARSLVVQRHQLHVAARQAEAASRAKMDFLAQMSHEIRTPLNGIMGMIHFLNDTPLNKQQKDSIATIQNCSSALLNTLNDILDLSKIEAGKFKINNVNFSLNHLVKNIHGMMAQKAQEKGVTVFLDIAGDVPRYVCSDPNRLQQVLMNLVSNAIKFTEKGYVRITVEVRKDPPESLYFEIKDTGIGMTAEQQKNLFQKFAQADGSIAGKYGGTGLGLSIARQLVTLMDGEIGVSSAPGQGSLFWFAIPLVEAVETITPAPDMTRNLTFARDCHVLIAEDNHINQMILTRLLDRHGIRHDMAADGRAAVKMARENPGKYKLVLMDMQMPHMDGVEATKAIRALGRSWREVPIIGLTGNVLEQHIQQCIDAGMVDHISKPIDPAVLYQKIHPYLKAEGAQDNAPAPEPLSALDELRMVMGEDYVRKFITNAHTEIAKLYENIASAYSQQRITAINSNAHELKSVSGSIGLAHVMKASEILEYMSRSDAPASNQDELGSYIVALGDAVATARGAG